jgi:DNA replication protein DnaD
MKNSINQELKKPITTDFSAGFYDWSIFLTNFYLRVRQVLKIDYESFMILQITLGYYLNTINKSGSNSIDDLSFRFEEIINEKTKKNSRLSVTSISSALNLPRETVNRKIDSLIKMQLLAMNNKSIIIGVNFQKIFGLFALETTHDLGKLITRWNNKDYLDRLISLVK